MEHVKNKIYKLKYKKINNSSGLEIGRKILDCQQQRGNN